MKRNRGLISWKQWLGSVVLSGLHRGAYDGDGRPGVEPLCCLFWWLTLVCVCVCVV